MRCFICKMPLKLANHGVCSQCVQNLPKLHQVCMQCGLAYSGINNICYRCRDNRPYWDELIAVSDYVNPLKKMVHHLKFYQKIELTHSLARLMFLAWYQRRLQRGLLKPDLITCVPLHRIKYWTRGFNQAEKLAKPIAYWIDRQFNPHLLQRKHRGLDQKNLSLLEREKNVCSLFSCEKSLTGKSLILIDDIVTTGNTLNEISKILKKQGVISIQVVCLCRTML